jgi:hypothetical protein
VLLFRSAPAGELIGDHFLCTADLFDQSPLTRGRGQHLYEFESVLVSTTKSGEIVHVGDPGTSVESDDHDRKCLGREEATDGTAVKGVHDSVSGPRTLRKDDRPFIVPESSAEAFDLFHRRGEVSVAADEGVPLDAQNPGDRGKPAAQFPLGDESDRPGAKCRHDYNDVDQALVVGKDDEPTRYHLLNNLTPDPQPDDEPCDGKQSDRTAGDVPVNRPARTIPTDGNPYLVEKIPPEKLCKNESK